MYKIGEFSQMSQVSKRMLRHYDKIGLLPPAVTDSATGYRFYTLEQLRDIHRIVALRDLGFSLEQIIYLMQSNVHTSDICAMLTDKRKELEQHIDEAHARLDRVAVRLRLMEMLEPEAQDYDVVVKTVPAMSMLSGRTTVPHVRHIRETRHRILGYVYQALEESSIQPVGYETVIYHTAGAYREDNIDLEVGLPVAKPPVTRPLSGDIVFRDHGAETQVASVIHHGKLWEVGMAITALYIWANEHSATIDGFYRELHLFGSELSPPPESCDRTVEMQAPFILHP